MSIDFAALLVVSLMLAALIVGWGISWVVRSPSGRYWPLDIHVLNSAFFLLLDFQFLFASQYVSFRIGEQTLNCSDSVLLTLQVGNAIVFCLYATLLKLLAARTTASGKQHISSHSRLASLLVFLIIASVVCGVLAWSIVALGISGLIELVGARQYRNEFVFVILNASPFAIVGCLYVIFKARSLPYSLAAVVVAGGVAVLSGGRGNIVSAFLLLVCACLANGRPLNPYRMLVFGVLPLIVVLQAYTMYVRYIGFQKIERGDIWFGQVVESETFAIWKSVYAVSETGFSLPYPFYSLSASLFFPVPRSIAEFKPEPPSTMFTKIVSPVRFENTGSEITLSGLGAWMAEFGPFSGALLFGGFLALVSSFQYRLSMQHNRQIEAFVLYFYTFSLWRSDMFTASRVLWTFLIVTAVFLVLRLALSLLVPQSSVRLIA
ncbi:MULTISPECIES: hypothetical protein [unclassified Bradyrhizobium]|uniref:hypothetical protein n=1 Tax=unclassified Bradyrhizobium TaxID=2631580 RepID=UPI001FF80BD2|nr:MULTISPECIES: hypothetical protein [unclassified Bradyrhizobium]MCK1317390.1 hypothetical protein [Bradyrhizobium sp. 23]MCK1510678.1 hypothetical protein [Bradyrhizobium sp. 18]MCK1630707.1 hypothetical protein [Bradyrhizobium sp. 162]MCK1694404.1 hypothetical protein [Bradyrhizobium sp. 144]